MTAQDLKNSILQLAVQGKLVQQYPEDGTATDLLKHIAQKKSDLIKDGALKKEKPLPAVDANNLPFDVPENWVWISYTINIQHLLSLVKLLNPRRIHRNVRL